MQNTDLSTVLGFYSFIFVFVQLCLAIQAGNYGFGLVSIEETELTADFLLSKPVSRAQVMTSKLLAALTSLTITNLVVWVISFIAAGNVQRRPNLLIPAPWSCCSSASLIFQLFFLAVGLVISLLVKRVRSVTPYSLGLGFGMYVLSAFSAVLAEVKLEYITPFKHWTRRTSSGMGRLTHPWCCSISPSASLHWQLSYWLYLRRDIHAVS